MGCASSGARALCKGQGVENDKPGFVKSAMASHPDTQSAVAGLSRSGTDILNSIHERATVVAHDEPDDMSSIVKNGRDIFEGVRQDAFEGMSDFGMKAEKAVKMETEDLIHRGESIVEDVADTIEDQVSKAAESVMGKVEELTEDIKGSFGSTKSKGLEMKEDVDKKIDDLLANTEGTS